MRLSWGFVQSLSSSTASRGTALQWAWIALGCSVSLTGIKVVAWWLTGSVAILSDALESVVNIITSGFAVWAVRLAEQPRDADHPYGHGRVEYVAAAIEGLLIAAAGVGVLWVAVPALIDPPASLPVARGAGLAFGIAVLTWAMGTAVWRAGKRLQSPTIEADGEHLRTDAVTTLAVTGALIVVGLTGWIWVDATVAVIVAAWLFWKGGSILRRAFGGLMDEARPELLDAIAIALWTNRRPGWLTPHHAKVHRLGQAEHVDLHIVFPRYWSLERTHDEVEEVERVLRTALGERTEVMVHMEPCTPRGCGFCEVEACPVRDAPQGPLVPWTGAVIRAPFRQRRDAHDKTPRA